jgi:DNA damage-inducible protein 1
VATLKAILEAETGVPTAGILLKHNGVRLPDSEALSARGVHTGDLIMMERAAPAPPRPAAAAAAPAPAPAPAAAAPPDAGAMHPDGSAVHPELVMAQLRGGGQLASLPESLRGAILAGDVAAFQSSLRAMAAARRGIEAEEQRLMRAAEEDPFNPEVQRQLEEAIQKKNVDESYKHTMEEHPGAHHPPLPEPELPLLRRLEAPRCPRPLVCSASRVPPRLTRRRPFVALPPPQSSSATCSCSTCPWRSTVCR